VRGRARSSARSCCRWLSMLWMGWRRVRSRARLRRRRSRSAASG